MDFKEQINLVDENGKHFSFSLNDMICFNLDLSDNFNTASVSQDSILKQTHEILFVDESGNPVNNLQIIQDMQSENSDIVALDISMEATHSGNNLNFTTYYEDSMEKDSLTFLNPFRKPMLKNHNSHSGEPLGRIISTSVGPSELTEDRTAIYLTARVTDKESFSKFLDGRYSTVSIGGSMGTVICNICGKTIFKDNKLKFCGHWRGETYKDQVCYWGARDITYNEVSVVNNPADIFAQIVKVTVIKKETEQENNREENNMGDTNKNNSEDELQQKFIAMIDKLLENHTNQSTNSNSTNQSPTTNTNDSSSSTSEPNMEQLKKDLKDAQEKITQLEAENNLLKDEQQKIKTELELSKQETNNYKEMALTLAATDKENRIEKIIEKEKKLGTVTDETKDSRVAQLQSMSVKDLNSLSLLLDANITNNQSARQPAQVSNPTLANNNEGKTNSNNNNEDSNSNSSTVSDYSNRIVDKIFNNH